MSYVYFIAPEAVFIRKEDALRVVKIGYTKSHPKIRLDALQTGSPVSLELIAFVKGDQSLERAFHEAFAPLRWQGEWFLLERKLRHFLGYFEGMPPASRLVSRDELVVSLYDNVFTQYSPHPDMSDEDYLASADPQHLLRWFPEVCDA